MLYGNSLAQGQFGPIAPLSNLCFFFTFSTINVFDMIFKYSYHVSTTTNAHIHTPTCPLYSIITPLRLLHPFPLPHPLSHNRIIKSSVSHQTRPPTHPPSFCGHARAIAPDEGKLGVPGFFSYFRKRDEIPQTGEHLARGYPSAVIFIALSQAMVPGDGASASIYYLT